METQKTSNNFKKGREKLSNFVLIILEKCLKGSVSLEIAGLEKATSSFPYLKCFDGKIEEILPVPITYPNTRQPQEHPQSQLQNHPHEDTACFLSGTRTQVLLLITNKEDKIQNFQ